MRIFKYINDKNANSLTTDVEGLQAAASYATKLPLLKLATAVTLAVLLAVSGLGKVDSSAAGRSGDFIKVGLRYGTADRVASIESPDGFALYDVAGGTVTAGTNLSSYKKLNLVLSSDNVVLQDANGQYISDIRTDGSQIVAASSYVSNNGYFSFGGKKYRGGVMPYINASGQMNIIDLIDIEDYVKGVVSAEIGYKTHMEALKAQAVATRSFVGANGGAHAAQGFDVCSTTHCQVYSGVSAEYDTTNAAVDATEGQMIYYNGKPVTAFYYANSGGYTENSEDVWVAPLGYLRSVKDEFSPANNWEVRLTAAQLTSALSSKGVGKVTSISIDSRNPSGYVSSMTISGTKGSITVAKDPIRSVFKSIVSLKSRMFNISTDGGTVIDNNASTDSEDYYAYNNSGISKLTDYINVISDYENSILPLRGISILGNEGLIKATSASTLTEPITGGTTIKFNKDSDVLIISGKGYGHGVGMSQQGAQVMGAQGYSYIDILKYYYTGIDIR